MLRKFYGDVLPDQGSYCLLLLPSREHVWASDLDELTEMSMARMARSGLYFGTAAFKSFASRKQSNVLAIKALRLDIDAGPEKLAKHGEGAVYATQREALAACMEFFRVSGAAPSYIVSSGAGLHIYYCFTESVEPHVWLPLAQGLSRLGHRHGLRIDPSVTEDSARVLRVPGAPHQNGKTVAILKDTGVKYTLDQARDMLGVEEVKRTFDMSINDDLDLAYQGPPSSALKVASHCGALRYVAQCKGDVQEPYWRAMIGLVKRTVEGLDIAQEWSEGHPDYDPDEVTRKFDAWATGPTTCAEFSRHSKACEGCAHRGKIKSPINLGLMTETEIKTLPEEDQAVIATPVVKAASDTPWEGRIPAGFSVEKLKSGRHALVMALQTEKESPTGEVVPAIVHVPFTTSVFWFSQWAEANDSDDTAQVTLNLLAGQYIKRYTMDQSIVASPNKLLEFLSGKTIHTTSHGKAAKAMQDYAKAQLQHIYDNHKNLKVTDHFGLRTLDDGELVCVHGKHTIFADGSIRETMLNSQLRSYASAFPVPLPNTGADTWGPSVWDSYIIPRANKHVEFLRKYYGAPGMERFQLAIMLSIASPFMAFVTGEYAGGPQLPNNSALTVSLYSRDTARGKTSAAASGVLAYGMPGALTNDSGKAGATVNARLGALSLHGTLPGIMDETTSLSASEVATIISSVANGAGKRTMTNTRTMRQEATWALINVITTNKSQRDLVADASTSPAPLLYRMIEIDVDDMPEFSQELRESFREDWAEMNRECAGALGALIHREICALGLANMTKLVARCVSTAEKLMNATQSARFQTRGLGSMLALGLILRRLGIHLFDTQALTAAFKVAFDANVEYVEENTMPTDPLQVLARFLLDIAPDTIVTQDEHGGGFNRAVDRPLNVRVPEKPKARHILSSGVSYVAVEALKAWCSEKGLSAQPLVTAARHSGVLLAIPRLETGGRRVNRSNDRKCLTKGMAGDMKITCPAYTFSVRKLNTLLRVNDNGFELVEGSAHDEEVEECVGT